MRIAIVVEGGTEKACFPKLREFLTSHLKGRMPRLEPRPYNGLIPKQERLRKLVYNLLAGRNACDAVIALTDVYTGRADFTDAADAKAKMRKWVGENDKFFPHAAQFEFEAWLIPYWETILKLSGHKKKKVPRRNPELINHGRPPSHVLSELFHAGKCSRHYSKVLDSERILRDNDLMSAVQACSELKAFVNTILQLCGGKTID